MSRDADTDDALLDLLYGELEGEARARAEARVAADAEAAAELEGLRGMRGAMRTWHQETEAEPSRGIADLLAAAKAARPVATAAAVARDDDRGLWARIVAWMQPLLAHPGLAAAATLVVVAGVAGTFYVSGRGRLAEPTLTSQRSSESAAPATGAGAPAEPSVATPTAAAAPAAEPPPPPPPAAAVQLDGEAAGARVFDKADRRAQAPKEASAAKAGTKKPARARGDSDTLDRFEDSEGSSGTIGGVQGGALEGVRPPAPKPAPAKRAESKAADAPTTAPAPRPAAPAPAPTTTAPSGAGAGAGRAEPSPSAPADVSEDESMSKKSAPSEAQQLTREAQAAARQSDCAKVRKISDRVREIDAQYHANVFRRDAALARCLDAKTGR